MKFKTFTLILFTTIMISSIYCDDQVDKNEPTVSIHAEDTHLPTILSMLAKQSDYNIVTGPNVQTQEKLTIHLDDVPISQAINLIKRSLHNSLNKSNAPLDMKTEYAHFLLSSTKHLMI